VQGLEQVTSHQQQPAMQKIQATSGELKKLLSDLHTYLLATDQKIAAVTLTQRISAALLAVDSAEQVRETAYAEVMEWVTQVENALMKAKQRLLTKAPLVDQDIQLCEEINRLLDWDGT